MTEYLSDPNMQPQNVDIIPTREFSDPSRRTAFEGYFGTPLGQYVYEFNGSQYAQVAAVDLIGDGVVGELNKEFSKDGGGFRSLRHEEFNNPDGTFSGGAILFGALSREYVEERQPLFEGRINRALEALGSNLRLGTHTQ
jgi:hypothetical protein